MLARGILGSGPTGGVSFRPFPDSSGWWWLSNSVFLIRISCHKTTHANGYYGAWPGWAVSISMLPLTLWFIWGLGWFVTLQSQVGTCVWEKGQNCSAVLNKEKRHWGFRRLVWGEGDEEASRQGERSWAASLKCGVLCGMDQPREIPGVKWKVNGKAFNSMNDWTPWDPIKEINIFGHIHVMEASIAEKMN